MTTIFKTCENGNTKESVIKEVARIWSILYFILSEFRMSSSSELIQ